LPAARQPASKAGRTLACGDRHLNRPPIRKANRSGDRRRLESARHRLRCGNRALSLPPLRAITPVLLESWSVNRTSVRHPFEAGWRPKGCGDQDLSAPPTFAETNPGSADKDRLVPSPRCKRGPFGARGSIPSTSHQLRSRSELRLGKPHRSPQGEGGRTENHRATNSVTRP